MRNVVLAAVAGAFLAPAMPALAHSHNAINSVVRLNNLDYGGSSQGDRFSWDLDARVGTYDHRLLFRTEGEQIRGQTDKAEIQLFYNRPISEFWDVNVGWRRDFFRTNRNYGAFGFSGIAPYFFEVEATAYVSEEGVLSGRLESSTDLLIARSIFNDNGPGLYLKPAIEINASAGNDRELEIRRGLTDMDLSLQLRYEFTPQIAPYVQVGWERQLGETANLARANGERISNSYAVIGIRSMF
ncbi:copper resistance protein B [Roseomonas sp. F4]|uniref:Copper resistance protein B n=2 Tax=Falsiroseomonas TaxID=2870713 RepID=A0ABS6HET5_9PROT|nr:MULTISPECIES: copper resistance protein B [Acetobacteraceae]MBU8547209.1 copper resistance protein B [Roseomonas oleicola]NKE45276.1 copper resistance protein B [Falsiroseomonas frigidaquae]